MTGVTRFRVAGAEIVHQTIEGEVVIINLARGHYYSLDGAGAAIWDALDAGATLDEIVDHVARLYAGSARADLARETERLVGELEAAAVIVALADGEADGRAPGALPTAGTGGAFEPPVLHVYTDMEELLLLDPIHEVDESGWPGKPRAAEPAAPGAPRRARDDDSPADT